jgi:hypothetical protein
MEAGRLEFDVCMVGLLFPVEVTCFRKRRSVKYYGQKFSQKTAVQSVKSSRTVDFHEALS